MQKSSGKNSGAFLYTVLSHGVEPFVAVEMLAPIAVVEARDLDAISAGMDKAVVADINADMGNSWTVRIFKEYQIS